MAVIAELKSIRFSSKDSIIVDWISDFTMFELVALNKRGSKVGLLVLKVETLLSKKIIFVCC